MPPKASKTAKSKLQSTTKSTISTPQQSSTIITPQPPIEIPTTPRKSQKKNSFKTSKSSNPSRSNIIKPKTPIFTPLRGKLRKINLSFARPVSKANQSLTLSHKNKTTQTTKTTAPTENPLWTFFYFWMFNKSLHSKSPSTTNSLQTSTESTLIPLEHTQNLEYHEYLNAFVKLGPISTVEQFFQIYTYLKRPNHNTMYTYHLFRDDLEPTWECPGNAAGGKYVCKVKKGHGARVFEMALLMFIGNEGNLAKDEICGVVVQIRKSEDVVSIWVRSRLAQNLEKSLLFVKNLVTRINSHEVIPSFDFIPHPTDTTKDIGLK